MPSHDDGGPVTGIGVRARGRAAGEGAPGPEVARGDFSLGPSEGAWDTLILDVSLQNCKRVHFCCFKLPTSVPLCQVQHMPFIQHL